MTDGDPRAEVELVRRCADGDESAWATFVDTEGPRIHALVRRMLARRTGRADDAAVDEVVADVFLALLRRDRALLRQYDPRWRLSTYLGVICRTEVGRLLRRRRRMHTPLDTAPEPRAEGPSPAGRAEAEEERLAEARRLREALDGLAPRDRLLLELRHLEGLDYRALAALLDVSEESVGSLLSRARRRLEDRLR